jgi:hypothetical protein
MTIDALNHLLLAVADVDAASAFARVCRGCRK